MGTAVNNVCCQVLHALPASSEGVTHDFIPCLTITLMYVHRFITTLNDPYKQGQYSNLLKSLQEERALLQELESALDDIAKGPAAPPSRPSQVSGIKQASGQLCSAPGQHCAVMQSSTSTVRVPAVPLGFQAHYAHLRHTCIPGCCLQTASAAVG